MKTQVAIYVKNESIISRFFSLTWFIDIFRGSSINAYVDDDNAHPIKLKASSKPHILDLAPGVHSIYFKDNEAMGKKAFNAFTGTVVGGTLGMGTGSVLAGTVGSIVGSGALKNPVIDNGAIQFNLDEGKTLSISIKPKRNGTVNIKVL